MLIEQFEDKALSHYSYAILSESESKIILIDPSRDIKPYLAFAEKYGAKIIGVIETHPHADFISSHLEMHQRTGATIYCSRLIAADYPHKAFDEGDIIEFGKIKLKALNTPGHSPDSISVVLEHGGKDKAVFTGDTLFIGDCGRPDLRESAGNLTAKREELALQMYNSLRNKLMALEDDVLVYPAHGAGTLCGKSLSDAASSTIGKEKASNWCLQPISQIDFVKALTEEQPFIPKYFGFDVELNKKGALPMAEAISKVSHGENMSTSKDTERLDKSIIIVDTRPAEQFKDSHLPNSINIMADGKFESWLGSIITPGEPFYLAAENQEVLKSLIERLTKVGYESFVKEAFILSKGSLQSEKINLDLFKSHPENYTIVDVRNDKELKEKKIFNSAINIPLPELRDRIAEVPNDKPIVVHCAGGYRSAAGSSIIKGAFPNTPVFDLSKAVNDFGK